MKPPIQEIRFAVFGSKSAGKTTMLAAYYGSQQSNSFFEEHGYYLSADKSEDGNTLLSHFHRLEDGVFPPSSSNVHEYEFSFYVGDLKEPSFKIKWLDYPGGWWEREPSDSGEKAARDEAILSLLDCHACIFLLDGEKYVKEGQSYVKKALDQFRNEGKKLRRAAEKDPAKDGWPRTWIIAISKADLLPESVTAEAISNEIIKGANDSINGLAKVLEDHYFGNRVLLISSVRAKKSKILNANVHIGLPMLAPAVLLGSLEELRDRANDGNSSELKRKGLEGLQRLFAMIDRLDDFLPKKYQFITAILKALQIEDLLASGAEVYRKRQETAVRKKQVLAAGVEALKAQISSPEGRKVYFQSQRNPNL